MIDVQTELECLPQQAQELIRRVVERALALEGAGGDVCVLITDAEEIQRLNAGYRNIDHVTDVLTFPAWEGDAILCPPDGYLGDIAICFERAEEQAEEYGHSLERELAFLAAHGALHLLGYDHMEPDAEQKMIARQNEILNELGYTR
jgi:probable rRNA maturation factor